MITISTIAELLVKIGADSSGLNKELSNSKANIQSAFSANPINEFTSALTGATNGISGMIGKISGLATLAATGFGLESIVSSAVNAGESMYQLSTTMGVGTGEAMELSRILRLTGSDMGTFQTAMLRVGRSYLESGEAGEKCRDTLAAVGATLVDGKGKLLPLTQQLAELSKGYQLAAANGWQEEYIMNTLGARGLSLIGTLKNYNEMKEIASKRTGAGIDPEQMHELEVTMKALKEDANTVGLAFTSAFAPIAQELLPEIGSGLQNATVFLSQHKSDVVELTKDVLELIVAYKSIQMLTSAGNAVQTFWQTAATEALASTATQSAAATELSVAQERAIARAVAASDKMYAKMQTDAVKTAQAAGLSAEETASVIAEKSIEISTAAAEAATAIRTKMTEAFLATNAAALESATAVTEALTVQGEAATIAGQKSVAANEMTAASARTAAVAQEELAVATALPGDAAIVAGEKTVGAMATAEVAVRGLLASVWALMGGWIGLIAIMGYGAYKAYEYGQQIEGNYEKTYSQKPELSNELADSFHEQDIEGGVPVEPVPEPPPKPEVPSAPQIDMPAFPTSKEKKAGKSDAEKEWEKLQKEAEQVNKAIDSSYNEVMHNKVERVDDWYAQEKAKLDESAAANSRYTEALGELDTVYAEKKRKAYAEMLSNSTNIWTEAAKNARTLNDLVSTAGVTGVDKQRLDIQNKYNDALAETVEKYKKLSVEFMGKDTESQTQYLLANPDVKKNDDGSLDFSKRIDAENLANKRNFEQQIKDLHYDSTKYKETLDQAYSDHSMSELQSLLNSEAAMENQYRIGQEAAMKEYYDLWTKTHRTSMDEMAEAAQSFDSGLVSIFTDIGKSIKSAGDLAKSFGSLVLETIWKIKAEELAANISMNIFGGSLGGGNISNAGLGGKADFSLGNTDWLHAASGGAIYGPGTGTSDSILAWLSNGEYVLNAATTSKIGVGNLDKINRGYAAGGLVTGPSLSSLSGNSYNSGAMMQSGGKMRSSGGVAVIVNNNGQPVTATATDNGINSDGMREIIIDLATDGVLDKASRSPVYARNMRNALGVG